MLEEQAADTVANKSQNLWTELEKKRRELETIVEYQTKEAILSLDGSTKARKILNTFST